MSQRQESTFETLLKRTQDVIISSIHIGQGMTRDINSLYEAALNGGAKAEAELFSALTERFSLFAHQMVWNREEAEDLVQAALAVVAAEYREVAIEVSFAAWAHKILENRLLGYIQKQRREKGRNVSSDTDEYRPEEARSDPTLRMKLLACLKRIGLANRRYARIINLHHFGYARDEICRKMRMTLQQSYVVMSRARSMLKKCLDEGEIHS